ncbi:YecA family protein [Mergibacter septicus]|uniref:UPF0149 protein CEP48_01580 n=1 Tax=Mergibacter septicus TaxID=221402 RepID=A0A8D4IYU6_9PAST|nr:YecA family protein [Mergibacter septicus]AWX14939.1 YecA family protein [Mergibacter septicus]QDJ12380.1 YecA family protein [Mergibacter septicus]QDJ14191.1 YecA family protein [Mergibacter septicus]UTU48362.1 YecA family protein [Mergibacter septicus]WMR96011.1 YecA family protein [Mergibacter septicus]
MSITSLQFNQELKQAGISLNGVELHGFLSGLICGGIQDDSWQTLMFQFSNDNHAYPTTLLTQITDFYQKTSQKLADVGSFEFSPDLGGNEDPFSRADALSEWTNHFLLGLGLAQPKLDNEQGDIAEALADLREICQLGYDLDEDQEELAIALEEVVEYIRTIAALFHTYFSSTQIQKTQVSVH